ncbi:ABC transporter permease [Shewanella fidelis]|uniref:ABC transporter permease n=1 Tax=Shewanella fidelis TaxID=173509 RepID=A0AAW8NSH7_9GAMM|nr:FtsX-like permease family protein [Shewanella fidelis]MDR8525176.1 ABC transporter permease [Shewanella fidelis]MDW4811247.1 ABC transporter permease [Shewanella fidelis]MDW4814974.1 ABC transporter permease [Shewanella fidelis]MDW4819064.1 ABC transporter permease [Shewanella fidelis]MDW4823259.1 ABC transporter permease [Shewanella fidelis]
MSSPVADNWLTIRLTLAVFSQHYRKSPLQAGAILLGIVLAVTLLIGVRATNENAVRSYSEATELLSQRAQLLLAPSSGKKAIDESIYFKLRQAGLTQALAVLNDTVTDNQGKRWDIQASDLVAALSIQTAQDAAQQKQPDQYTPANEQQSVSLLSVALPLDKLLAGAPYILMSQSFADDVASSGVMMLNNIKLNVIRLPDELGLGNAILMDISLGQRLVNRRGQLSYIALFGQAEQLTQQVNQVFNHQTSQFFDIAVQDDGEGLTSLTRSFHLNLTAMSLLAFVVGLFIAYNGVRYSLLKRQKLLVQLQQQGVPQNALLLALLTELLALVIIGSLVGFILGLQLSHWLQPMIALTLEQLYGARLMPGLWQWSWLYQAVGLTFIAALVACYPLFTTLAKQPLARSASRFEQQSQAKRKHTKLFIIALSLLGIAGLLFPFTQDYQHSLALLGVVTFAIPLLLPFTLQLGLTIVERFSKNGLWRYAVAESKELIAPLSLAMMAMLLALTANISMNTLVGSFEITLKSWLDDRLYADLYIRPPNDKVAATQAFLSTQPKVTAIFGQWVHNSQYQQAPLSLMTRDAHSLRNSNQIKVSSNNHWQTFFDAKSVMISEPLAIKYQLNVGDKISLPEFEQANVEPLMISAIFYDYGNPLGQVIVSQITWQQLGLSELPTSIAASYANDIVELETLLQQKLSLSEAQMYNQTKIKQRALEIFKRTFSITLVLNSLTLLVAAIGLFSACLMLTQARQAPLARLYALGVSRNQLRGLVSGQMLIIVLFTCLLALPTGALLGYLLINKVTLQAFGWSIAMVWDWQAYFRVLLIAILASAAAVIAPLVWQTRKPLISSLQQEAL